VGLRLRKGREGRTGGKGKGWKRTGGRRGEKWMGREGRGKERTEGKRTSSVPQ